MRTDVAIRVEGLSKQYHIGAIRERRYRTLRDTLSEAAVAPFRRAGKLLKGQATGAAELDEVIWALDDVSFEVPRGQVVGIIGRNGAGKSTLLKVLSRITEPTLSYAEIRGRVGSLLEVGTGFHPELSGRENVFLNGAILGMPRVEIEDKFDEIVAFAEVAKFIDTPVKHYSTGMGLRLAFAVAAHLDPEILIVDEVLAVGDAEFQRKCLGKMDEVAHQGRTILLVSHNMATVTELCERALLIESGRIVKDGPPGEVIGAYLSAGDTATAEWLRPESVESMGELDVEIDRIRILAGGKPESIVPYDTEFSVEISYRVLQPIRDLAVLCGVGNDRGAHIWTSYDTDTTDWGGQTRVPGSYRSVCRVPARSLKPGRYHLSACSLIPEVRVIEPLSRILSFDVSPVGATFEAKREGVIAPRFEWTVEARVY
jgi:lipopolysaccharide transport system ATP-binding protein